MVIHGMATRMPSREVERVRSTLLPGSAHGWLHPSAHFKTRARGRIPGGPVPAGLPSRGDTEKPRFVPRLSQLTTSEED